MSPCRTIDLDHRQLPASGLEGVAFSCVSFLSNPQRVQVSLEGAPIDSLGRSRASLVIFSIVVSPLLSAWSSFALRIADFLRRWFVQRRTPRTHFWTGEAPRP